MSRARKVYVATQGEYSDYHIVAVFSRKADAEALANEEHDAHDHIDIATWEVRTEAPQKLVIYSVMHRYPPWTRRDDLTIHREVFRGYEWNWWSGMPQPGTPFVQRRRGKTLAESTLSVHAFEKELAEKVFQAQWGRWEAEFAGVADE